MKFCLSKKAVLAARLLLFLFLAACLGTADLLPAYAASMGKKPEPLEYSIFGLTLDDSRTTFRTTLKKAQYLHTKTESRYGYDVMCFTSKRRNVLFPYVYVATCPSTSQTVGVYVVGDDGDAILDLAKKRFGLTGNNLKHMPENSSIGGRMSTEKQYLKDYPNVSVSLYKNKPYFSYTLALESKEGMKLCRQQNYADEKDAAVLKKLIEKESNQARFVD